jgi:FkbM family methyltransferase
VRLQWEADEDAIIRGAVAEYDIDGRRVRFFIVNELDEIQGRHRKGEFYEREELAIIARHFRGGVFVDVGANVGNHSLYAAAFLDARKVIAFEPTEQAARVCALNMALNGFQDRFILHRKGLSSSAGFAEFEVDPRRIDNLGATRLIQSKGSTGIELARGDDMISERVDCIKVDTEGFELEVLEGLSETISTSRPVLFVEVENAHVERFEATMQQMGYVIEERYRRYAENLNLLAVPSERGSASA